MNDFPPKLVIVTFHQVAFLGHVVSYEGISVDPSKIEVVSSWPRPTIVVRIRSFLGLIGYYCRFVQELVRITSPITKLPIKGRSMIEKQIVKRVSRNSRKDLYLAQVLVTPDDSRGLTM